MKKISKGIRTIVIIFMIGLMWFGMFQFFKVSTKVIDTAAKLWEISSKMTVYNESAVKTDEATEVAKQLEAKRQRMIHSTDPIICWYANASDFWQATAGIGSVVAIVVVGGAAPFFSYLHFSRKENKKKKAREEEWGKVRATLQEELDMEDCKKMEKGTIITSISQALPEKEVEQTAEVVKKSSLPAVSFIKKRMAKMSPTEREEMMKWVKILGFSAIASTGQEQEKEKEVEIPKFTQKR